MEDKFEQYLSCFTNIQLKLLCSLLNTSKIGNKSQLVANIIDASESLEKIRLMEFTISELHVLCDNLKIQKKGSKHILVNNIANVTYQTRIKNITESNRNQQYIVCCRSDGASHYFTNIIYNKTEKDACDYCCKCKSFDSVTYYDNLFSDLSLRSSIIDQDLENTRSFCKYLHDMLSIKLKFLCGYFMISNSGNKNDIVNKLIKLTSQNDLQIIIEESKNKCILVECYGSEEITHTFFSNDLYLKNNIGKFFYEILCSTCGKICAMVAYHNPFFDPNMAADKPKKNLIAVKKKEVTVPFTAKKTVKKTVAIERKPVAIKPGYKPLAIESVKPSTAKPTKKKPVAKKPTLDIPLLDQITNSPATSHSQIDSKSNREKIPATIRNIVWNKYIGTENKKGLCFCCSLEDISFANFHCGHMISVKNGGPTIVDNLRPICGHCNTSIGAKNMIEFIEKYGIDSRSNINMLTNKLNQISTANVIPIATKEIKSIVWIKYACGKQNKKCFMGCDTVLLKDTFKCGYLRLNNDDGTNFRPLCDDCYDITKEHGISHFAKLHDISIVI
jgi:hypothetical protein